LVVANLALLGVTVSYGAGRHIVALSPEDASRAILFSAISSVPGILCFTIPKFAVIILLARLLSPGRWHKLAMWVVSIIYFLMSAVCIVLVFAQCRPVQAQWGAAIGRCWKPHVMFTYTIVHGVFGAVLDLYLAIYPSIKMMTLTWVNWKKKLALSSALGFGYW
jgi:hypothetical protein